VTAAAALTQAGGRTDTGSEVLAPDMRQLWQRYPPRPRPASWPATERDREGVLARLLAPPFTVGDRATREHRRRGLVGVINWLADQPRHLATAVVGQRSRSPG
jgi:hypothetical protein